MTNGSTTVTQLGALEVGSDGSLTQPIAALALVTPGYWVITDGPSASSQLKHRTITAQ